MIFHTLLGPLSTFELFCAEQLFCSKATELQFKKEEEEERTALGRKFECGFVCVKL